MRDNTAEQTRAEAGMSCAYLAFEVLEDSAHKVQILECCDALTTVGVDTELLMCPDFAEVPTAAELQQRYGLSSTPRIAWIPRDKSRWASRLRMVVESARAARVPTFAYTRRPLAALGALLGGAKRVILELHAPVSTRHDRVAFGLIRRSGRLRLVCISGQLAKIVANEYGMQPAALIAEHNGASFPVRFDYGEDSAAGRRVRAMYVGTFAPGRGLDTIFELAERHPGIDFLVTGGPTPARLPGNVSVMPRLSHAEVPDVLAQADVLLMPYARSDQLPDGAGAAEYCSPLKMFEYLTAGRPIIASALPSISEILVDGENCLLAEPESVQQWSDALERLECDPGLRARLARGAAQTAEQHTTVARVRRILRGAGVMP